ncbi:glutactin-like [Neodiprion pinetum]|uniref:glutactin-like n=1 Tax=Neodiprion pinetum TaxID=441929 RepID=UPI0037233E43
MTRRINKKFKIFEEPTVNKTTPRAKIMSQQQEAAERQQQQLLQLLLDQQEQRKQEIVIQQEQRKREQEQRERELASQLEQRKREREQREREIASQLEHRRLDREAQKRSETSLHELFRTTVAALQAVHQSSPSTQSRPTEPQPTVNNKREEATNMQIDSNDNSHRRNPIQDLETVEDPQMLLEECEKEFSREQAEIQKQIEELKNRKLKRKTINSQMLLLAERKKEYQRKKTEMQELLEDLQKEEKCEIAKLEVKSIKPEESVPNSDFNKLSTVVTPSRSVNFYRGELAGIFKGPSNHIMEYVGRIKDLKSSILECERRTNGGIDEETEKSMESETLKSFIEGLPTEFSTGLYLKGYTSLSEAFDGAIDLGGWPICGGGQPINQREEESPHDSREIGEPNSDLLLLYA